jgi:hypothetical protein
MFHVVDVLRGCRGLLRDREQEPQPQTNVCSSSNWLTLCTHNGAVHHNYDRNFVRLVQCTTILCRPTVQN